MTKAELCEQLSKELVEAKELKTRFDDYLKRSRETKELSFGKRAYSQNLRELLYNFFVDRKVLKEREYVGTRLTRGASMDMNVNPDLALRTKLNRQISEQINNREYYFKRVKLDD